MISWIKSKLKIAVMHSNFAAILKPFNEILVSLYVVDLWLIDVIFVLDEHIYYTSIFKLETYQLYIIQKFGKIDCMFA